MTFKKNLVIVFSILLVFSIFPVICLAEDSIVEVPEIKVIINGQNITFNDVIISSKGRTLLPLRALLTNLGVQNDDEHIIWNNTEKSVIIIKDSINVKLVQGSNIAYLNGIPIKLDVSPVGYSKNGRTYIPARFVAQCLGKIVDWNNSTKSVIINDPKLVTVSTADELVAAIDSNTTIILKKGIYNLSEAKQEYSENNAFWESVFDGNQLVVKGVKNITLEGEGDIPVEIVVEPRYANVLSFRDSDNITIKNIKAGHTPEQGYCAGGVLFFDGCSNINIIKSELYGCGIEGLTLNNSNNLIFAYSAINNCNSDIMTINSSKDISFYKSKFFDNKGYLYGIEAADNCSLTFDDCDFYNNQIDDGAFFSVNLSKILVKNSRINNNSYLTLTSDTAALTMNNTKAEGNISGIDLWNEATKLYASGKYEDAIQNIDEVIKLIPDNYGALTLKDDALTLKGDALYYLGRYDEAIQCYDKILEVPGKASAYIYYSKGAALYQLGEYSESIIYYDESLKIDPEYINALCNKGDSLSNLGMFEEALECYDQVLALEPGYIEAMCGQANIFFYKEEYEEAIKMYDELINLNPGYVTAVFNKGVALYLMGKYDESLVCFDKIIFELDPNYESAYYYKAQSLIKLNKFSEAIDNLKKSIELFPANKENSKTDPAFDSIRNRDDFIALIQ